MMTQPNDASNNSANLTVFQFGSFKLRFVGTSDDPWWVAADVCAVLEISISQTRRLDEDEKGLRLMQTLGGDQEILCVNEYGLYSLILGSRKPQAKPFKKWVTAEVLPSIRQTGRYVFPDQEQPITPPTVDIQSDRSLGVQDGLAIIKYAFDEIESAGVERKLARSAMLEALIAQYPSMKPSLESAKQSLMLQTPDEGRRYNVTELGKMLAEKLGLDKDIKPTQINEVLQQAGFQEAKYRTNSKGKQVKEWHLTTAGESYGRLFLQSAQGNSKTIPAIRWLPEVLDAIASFVDR